VTSRPDQLIVVLGTATGVGKTWVAAALIRSLRDGGVRAVARKPVQSFGPDDVAATDAHALAAAAAEGPEDVCPPRRWYAAALAPPIAADALDRSPFTVADLVAELAWPPATAVGVVETVGGPRSPVAADGDSIDLAAALAPDLLVLVADAGLGAINAVRLSADAAATAVGTPIVVFLNRYRDEGPERGNLGWLRDDGRHVVTTIAELAQVAATPQRGEDLRGGRHL
jgi:dethiobiotin synthetase